jgi:hypothetical protein
MYTYLLPGLAAERARDIRRDASAASLIRLIRGTRLSRRPSRVAAAAPRKASRPVPRTARP